MLSARPTLHIKRHRLKYWIWGYSRLGRGGATGRGGCSGWVTARLTYSGPRSRPVRLGQGFGWGSPAWRGVLICYHLASAVPPPGYPTRKSAPPTEYSRRSPRVDERDCLLSKEKTVCRETKDLPAENGKTKNQRAQPLKQERKKPGLVNVLSLVLVPFLVRSTGLFFTNCFANVSFLVSLGTFLRRMESPLIPPAIFFFFWV